MAKGADANGQFALVNVGRAILQAGNGADWKQKAKQAAETFAKELR